MTNRNLYISFLPELERLEKDDCRKSECPATHTLKHIFFLGWIGSWESILSEHQLNILEK